MNHGFARRLLGLVGIATLVSTAAHAAVVLSYPTFGTACGSTLTCVGNAAEVGNVLRLTPATTFQSGAAYSTTAITLGANATFSTTFQFRFTNVGGINPADGITFVVAASPTGLGAAGAGLGYQGVANSVAIEFDTYDNGSPDLGNNHVAVDSGGVLTNTAAIHPYGLNTCDFGSGFVKLGCMANGAIWTTTISYTGTALTVTVRDGANAAQTVINNLPINMAALLGTTTAYVGFTAATGSGFENQDILSWQLANDTSLAAVPEPGSLALAGVALAGLFLRRRQA